MDLSRLKLQMVMDSSMTFFITLLFSLELIEDETISTACTDGSCIRYNPTFFNSLTRDECIFVLCHEVMHVALSHMTRRGDRDARKFNVAADYAINWDLKEAGFKMPKMGLCDKKYANMTAEHIYTLLPDRDDYPEPDIIYNDDATEEQQAAIDSLVIQGQAAENLAELEKCFSHESGNLNRRLETLLNPQLPWEVLLQDFMNMHKEEDYSLTVPDEEYLPQIYCPTMYSEGMGELNVYVDVSGSVSSKDLDVILTEVNAIKERLEPSKLRLVSFDTCIHLETVYTENEPLDISGLDVAGGGGTDVTEVASHIRDTTPELALIISDGYYTERHIETDAHLIFVILDNPRFKCKQGQIVNIKTKDYYE